MTAAAADAAPSSRDRLLDATERCLRRSGIRRTTVSQIAAEAGVSRAWLYRLFPDKASIVVATLGRTDEQFWADAHAIVATADGIPAQVAAVVTWCLERPVTALTLHLRQAEPADFAEMIGLGLAAMLPGMAHFWDGHLEAARDAGELRPDIDIARAAEWVTRLVVSLITVPSGVVDTGDPDSIRMFLEDFLVRGLG